jgi:hypothetical protein
VRRREADVDDDDVRRVGAETGQEVVGVAEPPDDVEARVAQ